MNQNNLELETNDLGYGELLGIFWRRRFWFLGVFSAILAVSVPLALNKKPYYQSYMQMLVEPNYQGKTNPYVEQEFTDTTVEVDYATQIKLLKSSKILERAVDKLGADYSEAEKAQLVQVLKATLNVNQIAEESSNSKGATQTKILQTVYTGSDPVQTKKILEAIQEVYLEYNLEQQEKRLQNGLNFINDQIPEARSSLVRAEAALTALSKKHNLISPEQEAIAIKENIRQIAQERAALKAQRSQTRGNNTALQTQLGFSASDSVALSRLSQSPRYQKLLDELQKTEIELAAEQTRFTDDSPIVQNLINQRNSQKRLLTEEAEAILGIVPPGLIAKTESLKSKGQFVSSDNRVVEQINQYKADLSGISQREASLAQTEARLNQKLVEFPELIAQYRSLAQETEVKREALQRLLEAKQELEIELSRGGFNWQVIEPPQLGVEVGTSLSKDLLLSVVAASFIGGTAAFIKEAMDDQVSTVKDIERQTAIPLLGATPGLSLKPKKPFVAQLPFVARSPHSNSFKDIVQWSPFRESLDIIYENIKLFGKNSPLKSLAITSAVSGEGKSTFVGGLALSVARHKQRVLIIDADLRHPSLHEAFQLNNQSGLVDYLAGKVKKPHIKQATVLGETVDIVTSGSVTADPVKLLSSNKLQSWIAQQQHNYDLILVDTPPAIGMVDAIKIAALCDRTLLVTRLDRVKNYELSEATTLLNKFNVMGIVANDSKDVAKVYENKNLSPFLLPENI